MAAPLTHPARLHATACLHGLSGPKLEPDFTYVQLACDEAVNLLPLRARFPEARFIATGQLEAEGVEVMAPGHVEEGVADFAVLHGTYSWVAADEQHALLERCRRWLAPTGVALVSYNTMPGWSVARVVRDLMLRAAEGESSPEDRVVAGKSAAKRLARYLGTPDHAYGALLAAELSRVEASSPAELLDDDLCEHNEALYFRDFAARAAEHGLSLVAELVPATRDGRLEAEVLPELLRDHARVVAEQQLDLLCNRRMRATLLCPSETPVRAAPDDAALVEAGFFSARLAPHADEPLLGPGHRLAFETASGAVVEVETPLLKAALLTLAEEWPRGLTAAELMQKAIEQLEMRGLLAGAIGSDADIRQTVDDLRALARRRQIDLLGWRPEIHDTLEERPRVYDVAIAEAKRSPVVTNARHEPTVMDELTRTVLRHCDGSRDLAALVTTLEQRIDGGALRVPDVPAAQRRDALTEWVLKALFEISRLGLLAP